MGRDRTREYVDLSVYQDHLEERGLRWQGELDTRNSQVVSSLPSVQHFFFFFTLSKRGFVGSFVVHRSFLKCHLTIVQVSCVNFSTCCAAY